MFFFNLFCFNNIIIEYETKILPLAVFPVFKFLFIYSVIVSYIYVTYFDHIIPLFFLPVYPSHQISFSSQQDLLLFMWVLKHELNNGYVNGHAKVDMECPLDREKQALEASTLHKELQAMEEKWEQERLPSPGKSTRIIWQMTIVGS